MLKILIACICSFTITVVFAQEKSISGKVIDAQTKAPLSSITILWKDKSAKIMTYKATDHSGNFILTTAKNVDSSYIEINSLGYKKKRIDGLRFDRPNIIELDASSILLDEVEVKSKPRAQRQGDTLTYDVSSFSKDEDRSIGDVLKRMPGIEVSESGNIKFQGKSISNFYIDGDDLLGDKYKIGTNSIGHKMVKDVQVLNNHEHMKVLKNKRFSDEVALNLVIKEDAKLSLSGQLKLGAGLPHQYDLEANSMLFNKKYKGLNVVQGNNTGRSLGGEVAGSSAESVLNKLGHTPINNLLSLGIVGAPPIASQHYVMNHSAGMSFNNLLNLKSKWQLKMNMQGGFDNINKKFAGKTTYLTEADSFSFEEDQKSDSRKWVGAVSMNASKNLENKFINDELVVEYENEDAGAMVQSNRSLYDLQKSHRISGFRNKLDYVPALKNGDIIQFSWFANYGSKPQDLTILPGVFSSILNDSLAYNLTKQYVEVPSFFTNLNTGYRFSKGKIKQYYGISYVLDMQQLQSYMDKEIQGLMSRVDRPDSFNDMDWIRSGLAFSPSFDYINKRLSASLSLPLTLQHTKYEDINYDVNERQTKLLFNPSFSSRYQINQEQNISFNYNRGNSFGNIENVYKGLIVRNYRSISNNSAGINESRSNNFGINYKAGKSLKMLFYALGANFSESTSSTMISNRIDEESSQTELIQRENKSKSYGINGGFDKYLFKLASLVKLNAAVNWVDYNQLFNDELLPFRNVSYNLSPAIEAKVWNKINVSYTGNASWTNTQQLSGDNSLDRTAFNLSQNIGFPITPFPGFNMRFSARHLFSNQQGLKDINYLFLDAFIRYRYQKWKTDFELNVTNIGNIKKFETYTISSNMQSQNSYELRGRMAVLKAVFNFAKKTQ